MSAKRRRTSKHPRDGRDQHPAGAAPAPPPVAGEAGTPASRRPRFDWLVGPLLGLVFFAAMATWFPYRGVFQFDPDEGTRLGIAQLVDQGYQLYGEVWNNQPPLLTYLSVWWCDLFGWSVTSGRLLILLFSALLIAALYDLLRVGWGHGAAIGGVLVLLTTEYYVRLSIAAMIGMPAIAFAVGAVWALVRWYRQPHTAWLVASGLLMACSLLTKAFLGFLLPLIGLWILGVALTRRWSGPPRQRWLALLPPAVWSVAVVALTAGVLLLVVPADAWRQLWASHTGGDEIYTLELSRRILWNGIRQDWAVFVLAVLGAGQVLNQRRWGVLPLVLWLGAALLVLHHHSPNWYHYHLIVAVPAAMLAGIAVGDVTRWRPRSLIPLKQGAAATISGVGRVLMGLAALGFGLVVLVGAARGYHEPADDARQRRLAGRDDMFVVELLRQWQDTGPMILADWQMYAFRAGFLVPPEMSITGLRRDNLGELSGERIATVIQERDLPLAVFNNKWLSKYVPTVIAELAGEYELIYRQPNQPTILARRDLAEGLIEALHGALETRPTPVGYVVLAEALAARGVPRDRVVAAVDQALELDDQHAPALILRARLHMAAGDWDQGLQLLSGYERAALVQSYVTLGQEYAWRLATCPDERYRNGRKSTRVIQEVMQQRRMSRLPPDPTDIGVYAAALAAMGRFDDAVVIIDQAVPVFEQQGQAAVAARLMEQRTAYQRGQLLLAPVTVP